MPPEIDKEIKLTNLGEAVAMVALGFDLIRLEKTGMPRQRWFILKNVHPDNYSEHPLIEFALPEYRLRKLKIDAKTFFETIKDVKTRIIGSYTPDEMTKSYEKN